MTKRKNAEEARMRQAAILRQQFLASLPGTYTQFREASGLGAETVREALQALVRAGLAVEQSVYQGRGVVYARAPGVMLPAVRGFVLPQIAVDKPVKKSKGSGVIAGHAYATGYRWGSGMFF